MILDNNYVLANEKSIPSLAFGTWQISNEDVVDAVKTALEIGYRHIDTAAAYENEEGVGKAIAQSGKNREDLFITTKIPAEIKTYEGAKESIEKSLKYLGVDYIDLMLIHAPRPWNQMFSGTDKTYFEENLAVYKAMEEAYNEGKIRSLGVSNFDERDINNILDNCNVRPVVNQIQVHIGFTRFDLINFCKEEKMLVMAYAPNATGKLPNNSDVGAIAKTYGVSTPQLSIRYDYQLGLLPIPRSTNPDHIKENAMIDFEIKDEDMEKLYQITI